MKITPPAKTNAARLLDSLNIRYELRAYVVDPDDLTAISVARKIDLPPEQVFKTLLAQTNAGDHLFAVVPGDSEVSIEIEGVPGATILTIDGQEAVELEFGDVVVRSRLTCARRTARR